MSGTYLVCDLCGKFGPPAAFVGKEGVRLCYQCAYDEDYKEKNHEVKRAKKTPQDNRNGSSDTKAH